MICNKILVASWIDECVSEFTRNILKIKILLNFVVTWLRKLTFWSHISRVNMYACHTVIYDLSNYVNLKADE